MNKNPVMQMKRFLCKKGRITIPFPIRACLGWSAGDVLSFTVQRDNSILISRVEPCRCDSTAEQKEIADFVETLTPSQQMALLVHLSEAWAVRQEGRKMNEMIRVLVVEPHQPPREAQIPNTVKGQQAVVQGYIEYLHDDDCIIVVNEEGKLNGMEGNRRIPGDVLVGPFFIAGDGGDDLCSLTDQQVEKYAARFAEPEEISQEEIDGHMGMTFHVF